VREKNGAGEGIRTLDPDLGNFGLVVRHDPLQREISLVYK